ncbi:MAG: trimethylamine methyltransferase family protein, partial [Desulfobacteraceae bacterium]|nr:trimethylamine methyltransferase family protein [Desulfobacteraceae bacterium]
QWRPGLFCRQGYEKWAAEGRSDLLARARRRLQEILQGPAPRAVDAEKERAIAALVAGFKGD